MQRPQEKNLTPFTTDQSREEAAKNGRKGGQASGEARRAKRTLKEYAEKILSCKLKDKRVEDQFKKMGIDPESGSKYTFYEAMLIGQVAQAIKGNTKAYNAIRDTVEPKDAMVGANVEDLSPLSDLLRMEKKEDEEDD